MNYIGNDGGKLFVWGFIAPNGERYFSTGRAANGGKGVVVEEIPNAINHPESFRAFNFHAAQRAVDAYADFAKLKQAKT
jgi:hypothetical protein